MIDCVGDCVREIVCEVVALWVCVSLLDCDGVDDWLDEELCVLDCDWDWDRVDDWLPD